jgi:hypothetical protein
MKYTMKYIIEYFILPIVDFFHPVVDIEDKFHVICTANNIITKKNDDIRVKMTLSDWDKYANYINRSNKSDQSVDNYIDEYELDYFDILIKHKIRQINRKIRLEINYDQTMEYIRFREILENEIGIESVNFRYRYVSGKSMDSGLFASILKDDSSYRRFKWCDRI